MLTWALRRILRRDLGHLETQIRLLGDEVDALRSRLDLDPGLPQLFQRDRASRDYQAAYEQPDPLVSVCVATYNRGTLLTGRCLPSLLAQTHRNLEVVVVGDACTDDTAERIQALGDPRVRFENLAERGDYPEDPHRRWMVAGSVPMNRALEQCRGSFITHLDDDDAVPPERIAKLLAFIRETRSDLVWHPFEYENARGRWRINEASAFRKGQVTTSSVFYHAWFRRIGWDLDAHQYLEPGDWNRFRKIRWLGARVARHPDLLLRHFMERNNAR